MTDMDWADEIANGFCSAGLMDAGQVLALDKSPERYAEVTKIRRDREASERKEIAAALRAAERRGRAAGMREAATLVENGRFLHDDSPPKRFANEVVPMLRAAAAKLEQPE